MRDTSAIGNQAMGAVLGYSEAEIDYFGVYCPQTSAVYLVPRKDVPAAAAHLRISPPRNGQTHGVRWAKDYLVS